MTDSTNKPTLKRHSRIAQKLRQNPISGNGARVQLGKPKFEPTTQTTSFPGNVPEIGTGSLRRRCPVIH